MKYFHDRLIHYWRVADVILYTLLQFPSTPAISTSIVVTLGIVLSGCAMLHSIAVWQKVSSSFSRFKQWITYSKRMELIRWCMTMTE